MVYIKAQIRAATDNKLESLGTNYLDGMSFLLANSLKGYQIPLTNVDIHNISSPLIELNSSPDEYLFYKKAIVKIKLQPLGSVLFQVYRKP